MMDSVDISKKGLESPSKLFIKSGDKPPSRTIMHTVSSDSSNMEELSFESTQPDESSKGIEDTSNDEGNHPVPNNTAQAASLFNLTSIVNIPVAGYFNYFASKAAVVSDSATSNATESTSGEISSENIADAEQASTTTPAANRTWGEWAGETSKMAAGVGIGIASSAYEVTKNSIEVTRNTLETTTTSLVNTGSTTSTDTSEDKDYKDLLSESGSVEIEIPARSECRAPFVIPKGSAILWQVRVKNFDLGFAVRIRRQGLGGAIEDVIEPLHRYKNGELILGGRASADHTRHFVFVFDNTYSTLRPKRCVYRIQIGEHLPLEEVLLRTQDYSKMSDMEIPVVSPQQGPGNGGQNQLEVLSAYLEQAKVSYDGLVERARQAGEVSIGAVQGGIGIAVAAPLYLGRAVTATLVRSKPPANADNPQEGDPSVSTTSTASDGSVDGVVVAAAGTPSSSESTTAVIQSSSNLEALTMSTFCELWVQLEQGSTTLDCVIIPRPALEEGFPLASIPSYLETVGKVHILASGEVTGGCQIFGYTEITVNERMTGGGDVDDGDANTEVEVEEELTSSYYVLLEITVTWRGPSVESPGYDDWVMKATVRSRCGNEGVLNDFIQQLKFGDAFYIM